MKTFLFFLQILILISGWAFLKFEGLPQTDPRFAIIGLFLYCITCYNNFNWTVKNPRLDLDV